MTTDSLRAHYLEAIARLQRGWVHETRSHLGNVSLQLDLMSELLDRGAAESTGVDRLRAPIERARGGVTRLEQCVERYLGAATPHAAGAPAADLAATLAELGDWIEPTARERRVTWSVGGDAASPGGPRVEIPMAVREALVIAGIGLLFEAPAGSSLAVSAGRSAGRVTVRFAGPARPGDEPSWVAAVREALAGCGGTIRAEKPGDTLELSFPDTPEAR